MNMDSMDAYIRLTRQVNLRRQTDDEDRLFPLYRLKHPFIPFLELHVVSRCRYCGHTAPPSIYSDLGVCWAPEVDGHAFHRTDIFIEGGTLATSV